MSNYWVVMSGGGGSDTFIYNAGYGSLEIREVTSLGGQAVLKFGFGITLSSLRDTSNGDYLTITDGIVGDRISDGSCQSEGAEGAFCTVQ
ncbi:hypothetical protein PPN31114_00202 [Pandoraea pneumonica]|uniref:Uncharacterized protein n=1 Tax=Pandoraea pneumonica TaxID=2508299 RepID=A0A5E4RKI9_9BURK|nr:hypothetical protein [Pandoraea pneumonica]VVD63034.1 hypothetical protein PPN31114_00202 [Pandoraea pneumonica]